MPTAAERLTTMREFPDEAPTYSHASGEQLLAAAVIRRALDDARAVSLPMRIRVGALAFLQADSDALRFWCRIGGLHPEQVSRLAALVLTQPGHHVLPRGVRAGLQG